MLAIAFARLLGRLQAESEETMTKVWTQYFGEITYRFRAALERA